MKKPNWWQTLFGSYDYPEEKARERKIEECEDRYGKIGKHHKKIKEEGKTDRWEWEWTVWTYHKIIQGAIDPDISIRKKGIWVMDGQMIYITCPHCAAIMNASNHEIRTDGEIHPCVVCPKCSKHVFMQLVGWTGGLRKEVLTEKEKKEHEMWIREMEEWRRKYPIPIVDGESPDTPWGFF